MTPSRRVDVDVDVLALVLHLQEEHLGDDEVGDVVVDRRADEDDPVLEEARPDVVRALAAARLFNDDRSQVTHLESSPRIEPIITEA